mmetsp:Transcript_163776/g.525234  ORF Transcript_163776/g.525234 Transcript_163776/m.525234 type:complete len:84 (+) Transcript_163776:110-361(+)
MAAGAPFGGGVGVGGGGCGDAGTVPSPMSRALRSRRAERQTSASGGFGGSPIAAYGLRQFRSTLADLERIEELVALCGRCEVA